MEIKVFPSASMGANCYTVLSDNAAIVVDPGEYCESVCNFLNENSDKQRLILLTHCHFDHIGGAAQLREKTQVPIAIGEKEFSHTADPEKTLGSYFGIDVRHFSPDKALENGEELWVGDIKIKCIETPGHTVGGMCYLINDTLFSGDTLFNLSIGRTDFPNGSFAQISNSIRMLYNLLDDNVVVLPGHGEATLIGYEKTNNPFVRDI